VGVSAEAARCRSEGYAAGRAGEGREACPYPGATVAASSWTSGWQDGTNDRRFGQERWDRG